MNALYELFSKRVDIPRDITTKEVVKEDGSKRVVRRPYEEMRSLLEEYKTKLEEEHPELMFDFFGPGIHCINRAAVVEEIESTISWAVVSYSADSYHDDAHAILKPERTLDDINNFIDDLYRINYDSGFGCQHLFGNIVYKDGSWEERWEYDGSEGWAHKSVPQEPDWAELERQIEEENEPDPSFYDDEIDYDEYDRYYEEEQERNRDSEMLDLALREAENNEKED